MPQVSELLTIGQRLELGVGTDEVQWFPTRLEDHEGRGGLTVAWPTDRDRRLIPVANGQTLELAWSSRDALYSATVEVHRGSTGGVPHLRLEVRGSWRRTQRRNAVRISVAIRPRIADLVCGNARRSLRLGLTNISATGVQVRSKDELRRGDLIDIAFNLMGVDQEVHLQARVRRLQRNERVWDAGCEFEGVSDRLAQRIVQFIFAQQRLAAHARRSQT